MLLWQLIMTQIEQRREPAIFTDFTAREIAESGYRLRNPQSLFTSDVSEFSKRYLWGIWKDSGGLEEHQGEIAAQDLMSKYVGRFGEIFKEIWMDRLVKLNDGRQFVDEPHKYPLRTPFNTDQIKIIVEKRFAFDEVYISAEDDNGLGLIFEDGLKPIAYGPRRIVKRVALLNTMWSDRNRTDVGTIGQALMLLVTEAKGLKFSQVTN